PLLPVAVPSRRGCDRAPVDPSDPGDRLRVLAYVWPDQPARRHRLEAALDFAASTPLQVEPADAADWCELCLSDPVSGAATVLFPSIVWQYLSADRQRRIEAAIRRAGERATERAPLAWLRMEPAPDSRHTELRLTLWPSGRDRVLAEADYHGRWVRWLGA